MKTASTATITQIASAISAAIVGRGAMENRLPGATLLATVGVPGLVLVPGLVPVPEAADAEARVPDAGVATRGGAVKSRLAAAAADGRAIEGIDDCVIGGSVDRDERGAGDALAAIFSVTRLRAAMIAAGSGTSATWAAEPMRAPAEAAIDAPADRVEGSGRAGVFVSDRHRSSHSSTVPPQPLTYAASIGRSGSAGPISAALM